MILAKILLGISFFWGLLSIVFFLRKPEKGFVRAIRFLTMMASTFAIMAAATKYIFG